MKTMRICSYYSEDDLINTCYNGVDGVYEVKYSNDIDLKTEIEKEYRDLLEKEVAIINLSVVLDYLIKTNKVDSYEYLEMEMFDCDYGNFHED